MSATEAVRPAVTAAPLPARPPGAAASLRAVVARGLRDHAWAPLTWGGSLGAMTALVAAIWPSIEGSVDELMRSYPEGLKEAFGIETLDSVERYVDVEMFSIIVPLVLVLFAVRTVASATVGAEERGHLDTLLSLPLSRRVLMAGSLVVTGIVLAAVLVVVWAMTFVAGTAVGTGISATTLAAGVVNVWPLAMAAAGLAALLAGAFHRPAIVTGAAFGTFVAMYVVDLVGKLSAPLEPFRVVSAFRYYGSAIQNGFDVSHAVGLTLVAAVLAVAGAQLFERRDIL